MNFHNFWLNHSYLSVTVGFTYFAPWFFFLSVKSNKSKKTKKTKSKTFFLPNLFKSILKLISCDHKTKIYFPLYRLEKEITSPTSKIKPSIQSLSFNVLPTWLRYFFFLFMHKVSAKEKKLHVSTNHKIAKFAYRKLLFLVSNHKFWIAANSYYP